MMHDQTVTLRGLKIHYRVEGHGPNILMIHGWASSRRMWAHLSSPLAATHRCWSLDLPGCGDSDKPADNWYSIPNYTGLLEEFIHTVDLHRAHLVGHSMGGLIALDLAAAHPEAVERLVVINPVVTGQARSRPLTYLNWEHSRPLIDLTLRLSPKLIRPVLSHPLGERLPAQVKYFRRRTEDFFKGTPDSMLGSGRATLTYDVAPRLMGITAPTLVIVGSRDGVVPSSEGRLAARQIPGSQLAVLRAGHLITDERPAETLRLVQEFLT
jgi:pimeloyl-ACP methyl ester carboxylesterase